MASFKCELPDEFLLRLSRLAEKTDEIIPKVLTAGGEVVAEKVKANLQSVIGQGIKGKSRSTGELISALGVSAARLDRNGNYNIKVGFSEPRPDGKNNAMIAGVLEYGKSGQAPKPFLKPAQAASKKACVDAMAAAFEKEVGDL